MKPSDSKFDVLRFLRLHPLFQNMEDKQKDSSQPDHRKTRTVLAWLIKFAIGRALIKAWEVLQDWPW